MTTPTTYQARLLQAHLVGAQTLRAASIGVTRGFLSGCSVEPFPPDERRRVLIDVASVLLHLAMTSRRICFRAQQVIGSGRAPNEAQDAPNRKLQDDVLEKSFSNHSGSAEAADALLRTHLETFSRCGAWGVGGL